MGLQVLSDSLSLFWFGHSFAAVAVAQVLYILHVDSHPVCEDCRKPPTENYKSFELKWPACLLLVAGVVMIGGGAMSLQGSIRRIGEESNNVMCKMLKFQDKTLNGFRSEIQNESFAGYIVLGEYLNHTQPRNHTRSYESQYFPLVAQVHYIFKAVWRH